MWHRADVGRSPSLMQHRSRDVGCDCVLALSLPLTTWSEVAAKVVVCGREVRVELG